MRGEYLGRTMSKLKTIFSCQQCGATSPKWLGRCPDCGEWNCYVEEKVQKSAAGKTSKIESDSKPTKLTDISFHDSHRHVPIGIGELDRVLGGGLVPGSATLIGGDPGIGKSTIILQSLAKLTKNYRSVLYISGEESASQIKMRAERLGVNSDRLFVFTENCLELILEEIKKNMPAVVAIDSIQTIYSADIASAPGTISQVREGASRLIQMAKSKDVSLFLIGHITKEGAIAGPKVMEHMVDTVLYFEGERGHPFRLLRSVKNRFGATCEIGVFEMTGEGLREVLNPSGLFLAERPENAAGSSVVTSLEGSRPLLVELQSLVSNSGLANPRRTCIGIDSGRVALLVAVLEKIVGLSLYDKDIFLNVAGGLRVVEPAVDLGAVASIHSSLHNVALDPSTVVIGEVGLAGEVRAVTGCETRLKEVQKMGFKRCIVPKSNLKNLKLDGLEVEGVSSVDECLKMLF